MGGQKRTHRRTLPDWDQLRVVLALWRGKTLSGAARTLNLDHTTIGRRLAGVERDLGGALFERSKDGFSPTPLGEDVLLSAQRAEREIDGLLRRIDGTADAPTGAVRITATPYLAAALFAPAIADFLRAYPRLNVELIGDNRTLNLSKREADLAVRMSRPSTPDLVAKKVGDIAFACYAASSDTRRYESQVFVGYDDESGAGPLQQYMHELAPADRLVLRSNSLAALFAAIYSGIGCGLLPCFTADNDARLRRVNVPRHMPPLGLWLVYHEDLRRSHKVRVAASFVDSAVKAHRNALVPKDFPFA